MHTNADLPNLELACSPELMHVSDDYSDVSRKLRKAHLNLSQILRLEKHCSY